MGPRSTRNRIRHAAAESIKKCDAILIHLKRIDDLAEGRSQYINEQLPNVVNVVDMVKAVLEQFRKGL